MDGLLRLKERYVMVEAFARYLWDASENRSDKKIVHWWENKPE